MRGNRTKQSEKTYHWQNAALARIFPHRLEWFPFSSSYNILTEDQNLLLEKRVSVYWKPMNRYYSGKVTAVDERGYRVEYDDGDIYWEARSDLIVNDSPFTSCLEKKTVQTLNSPGVSTCYQELDRETVDAYPM